jgi:hypothetical protein
LSASLLTFHAKTSMVGAMTAVTWYV